MTFARQITTATFFYVHTFLQSTLSQLFTYKLVWIKFWWLSHFRGSEHVCLAVQPIIIIIDWMWWKSSMKCNQPPAPPPSTQKINKQTKKQKQTIYLWTYAQIGTIDLNVWNAQTNNVLKCSCWEIFDDICFYLSAKKKGINEQEVEVLLIQK